MGKWPEWKPISEADIGDRNDDGPRLLLWNGVKVGEGLFCPWGGEYNDETPSDWGYQSEGAWRWANDSCSCCWDDMDPQPTHWLPLPPAPEGGE